LVLEVHYYLRLPEGALMKKQKGFSLIELLIVVAIILIIAAIAIPNLLRSRIAANEASAVGSIRSINTSQVTYSSTYPDAGFSPALVNLGPISGTSPTSAAAGLLDGVLGCSQTTCTKSGYKFNIGGGQTTYTVNADPATPGQTGQRYFFSDASGVIRYNNAAAATGTDSPLQ
jgi:type IV pilus assembly protein PilA